MMNRIDGKVALVTGATRGIGSEIARTLARAGASVVATGRREPLGEELVAEIEASGGTAMFQRLDVTDEADWRRVLDATLQRFGGLSVLVNNAGVIVVKTIEETSLDEANQLLATNLTGVFLGTRHALGVMKGCLPDAAGGGSIINVSSIAGMIGMTYGALYSMSKGGVRLFTKATAVECGALGYPIRVNSVHPTFIDTDMEDEAMEGYARLYAAPDAATMRTRLARLHPMGRFGTPDEVAKAVLYLASEDSAFVTGTELLVDGGFTAK